MPKISLSAAAAWTGETIFQAPPSFLSVVTSPDADLIVSSSTLSASNEANSFSCFDPVSSELFER